MKTRILILFIALLLIPNHLVTGQKQQVIPGSFQDSAAFLKMELNRLKTQNNKISSRLDSIISDIQKKKEQEEEESNLQKLLDEANQLAVREKEVEEDLTKKFQSGVRQFFLVRVVWDGIAKRILSLIFIITKKVIH